MGRKVNMLIWVSIPELGYLERKLLISDLRSNYQKKVYSRRAEKGDLISRMVLFISKSDYKLDWGEKLLG